MAKSVSRNILFLCTGNYYRSRFAEVLFNSIAGRMGLPWRATSKGLAVELGTSNIGPIAKLTLTTLKTLGVTDAAAVARMPAAATEADFTAAERVVALKELEHEPLMRERWPAFMEKVEYWAVDDDLNALPQVEQEVQRLIARLLGGGTRPEPQPLLLPEPVRVKKAITLKVGREVAGRRGKGVTTIFDTPLGEKALLELAGILKAKCGTGGTCKDGKIEIQGDQRERIVAELEKLGYKVKRVGG